LFGIGAGAIAWYYYSKRDTADASISYPDSTEPLRGQPAEEPLGSVQQEIPKQSLLKKRKRKQKQKRVPTIQELIRLKLKELAKAIQELNSIRENYATNEVTKSTIAIVEDQRDAKLKQKKQLEQRLQALQRVTSP
jgi:vacuolar-type H+-ATPase subunit I/STV1